MDALQDLMAGLLILRDTIIGRDTPLPSKVVGALLVLAGFVCAAIAFRCEE